MPFFGNLGTIEWIIIGIIVILLFGGQKMKELARGLGESGRELKKVRSEFKAAIEDDASELPPEEKKEPKRSKKRT